MLMGNFLGRQFVLFVSSFGPPVAVRGSPLGTWRETSPAPDAGRQDRGVVSEVRGACTGVLTAAAVRPLHK
jgi:hypothetical protein